MTAPTISLPDEGEALWGLGGLWIVRLAAGATGFALLEVRMGEGVATPLHRHADDDETFIVLEGSLALLVSGERVDAEPGAVVHLPGGELHAWRVTSPSARFLVIATARHEAFYRAACRPADALTQPPDAGTLDLPRIMSAGASTASRSSRPRPSTDRRCVTSGRGAGWRGRSPPRYGVPSPPRSRSPIATAVRSPIATAASPRLRLTDHSAIPRNASEALTVPGPGESEFTPRRGGE